MNRRYFPAAVLVILLLALCLTACAFENGKQPSGTEPAVSGGDPVPVWQFCHGLRDGLDTAVITLYTTDCETGLSPAQLSAEDEDKEIRRALIAAEMTGLEVLGFVFYGENLHQGHYYSKHAQKGYQYYHKYDTRMQSVQKYGGKKQEFQNDNKGDRA